MPYLILKLVHVASVVVFVGNITTGVFWGMRAHRSRNFALIASTFEGIIQSDRWFTTPGVIGVLVSGISAALVGNLPILGTGWILWGIVLFAVAGMVFGLRVAPLQRAIVKLSRDAAMPKRGQRTRSCTRDGLYGAWSRCWRRPAH